MELTRRKIRNGWVVTAAGIAMFVTAVIWAVAILGGVR